jgi:hypothetical protein
MDFVWTEIEKTRGVYDFSAYDTLVAALAERHIRPLFILDYENRLYEAGSPSTPDARAAFARFAAASARHFAGKTILWEIWNEPNISFWKPAPNVHDYAALALATAQAIKEADPHAMVIAPGMSTMDFAFAESCFQAGLLRYIDAVSFHPYRQTNPETVASDYATLRGLIARYAPPGKEIALVSSEWGYSTAGISEQAQAQYLTREWLSNLEQGIKVSIWYDWHDDSANPKDGESNFGTVNWDYSPKPAFTAAQALIHSLSGYRFVKRVVTQSDSDYLLIFAKGKSYKLAAWTTGTDHAIPIPFTGTATLTRMLGDTTSLASHAGTLTLTISQSPLYVAVPPGNTAIALAASWTVIPAYGVSRDGIANASIQFSNPLNQSVNAQFYALFPLSDLESLGGGTSSKHVRPNQTVVFPIHLRGMTPQIQLVLGKQKQTFEALTERVSLTPMDPLYLTVAPRPEGGFYIRIDDPSESPFIGKLVDFNDGPTIKEPVSLVQGQREAIVWLRGTSEESGDTEFVLQSKDNITIVALPFLRFVPYAPPPAEWKAALDGDLKVQSKIDLSPSPAGSPLNAPAAKLDYAFGTGWSFIRVFDPKSQPLSGKPAGETIWVNGDGSGNALRMRFSDSTGQTFQQDFGKCDWTGWRPVSCTFTGDNHWGGANDGIIHYPIKIDTIFLLDSVSPDHKPSSLLICDPEIVYGS